MKRDITRVRNIGVVASVDAGPFTCRERIVELAERLHAKSGDPPTAVARSSLATEVTWAPRSGPFAGESFLVSIDGRLRGVNSGGLVVLDAARGTAESAEASLRAVRALGVPCVVFLDDIGDHADLEAMLESLEDALDATAVAVHVPWFDDGAHLLDVIDQRLVVERGDERELRPLPPAAADHVARMRSRIVDVCADVDEKVRGAHLMGLELGADELARALRKATLASGSHLLVVTCGSLRASRGVGLLLDTLVTYLPSPAETPRPMGRVRPLRPRGSNPPPGPRAA